MPRYGEREIIDILKNLPQLNAVALEEFQLLSEIGSLKREMIYEVHKKYRQLETHDSMTADMERILEEMKVQIEISLRDVQLRWQNLQKQYELVQVVEQALFALNIIDRMLVDAVYCKGQKVAEVEKELRIPQHRIRYRAKEGLTRVLDYVNYRMHGVQRGAL